MQVQRQKVTIDTPGGPMPAQLARPATGGPFPAVCEERDSYRAEAAADFWQRLTAFFAKHLQG